jgi:hypothetical protein
MVQNATCLAAYSERTLSSGDSEFALPWERGGHVCVMARDTMILHSALPLISNNLVLQQSIHDAARMLCGMACGARANTSLE